MSSLRISSRSSPAFFPPRSVFLPPLSLSTAGSAYILSVSALILTFFALTFSQEYIVCDSCAHPGRCFTSATGLSATFRASIASVSALFHPMSTFNLSVWASSFMLSQIITLVCAFTFSISATNLSTSFLALSATASASTFSTSPSAFILSVSALSRFVSASILSFSLLAIIASA
ncbi:hypothetical protein P167DRAFT_540758 [Morchella conica CCBAS932]|uniref:Uncharacterized protein n=1 Tax=Morchella conica CCBAS932 TaxID=1392247 RepID=A0A3N4KAU6_9PEZI|nr:hypothetical protein P167DRAFT_540758 [Morchella conica CCBAS932]